MCTKELQVVDTHGQTKYIGIGTGLVKDEFQKQPCKIDGLGDVYRVENELNETLWLTQETKLSVFKHKLECIEDFFINDVNTDNQSPLNYDSFHGGGVYDPKFIKARNDYIFR